MLSAVQFNKNYKGMSANVVHNSTVRGLEGSATNVNKQEDLAHQYTLLAPRMGLAI